MSRLIKDPLLDAARVVLVLFVVLLIFVMAMVGIGLGALATVARPEVLAEIAEAGAPPSAYWAIIAAMLLIEGLLFLGLRFTLELNGIVKSVHAGDPFDPANANRLQRMGWIVIAAYAVTMVIAAIATWVASVARDASGFDFDIGLGGGGILLILVLFILARVFRQGAAMREDLEGTV